MAGLIGRLAGLGSAGGAFKRARRLIEAGKRAEAFPLLAKAAQSGIAEAEYLVGRAYLEAAGVPPSAQEAARWLEKAAERGYVDAQSLLGALYVHGVSGAAEQAAPAGPALFAAAAAGGVRPDFGARRALGAPRRGGRLGRRAGAARLHPHLRPGVAARPAGGRGAGIASRPPPTARRASSATAWR